MLYYVVIGSEHKGNKMLTIKWQNLSGHWFDGQYPDPMGYVIFEWKTTGGVSQRVEIYSGDVLLNSWSK